MLTVTPTLHLTVTPTLHLTVTPTLHPRHSGHLEEQLVVSLLATRRFSTP